MIGPYCKHELLCMKLDLEDETVVKENLRIWELGMPVHRLNMTQRPGQNRQVIFWGIYHLGGTLNVLISLKELRGPSGL